MRATSWSEALGPTEVSISGNQASRFALSFPADLDATTCDDGTMWLFPEDPGGHGVSNIDPGWTMTVYVVDVDGRTLAAAARISDEDATAALLAELDAVVASLRFGP